MEKFYLLLFFDLYSYLITLYYFLHLNNSKFNDLLAEIVLVYSSENTDE